MQHSWYLTQISLLPVHAITSTNYTGEPLICTVSVYQLHVSNNHSTYHIFNFVRGILSVQSSQHQLA